jgi:uncharacterized Fe-S cluster protein YjdI
MAKTKEYTNGEVTIVWEADKCMHAEKCWRGLPGVFDPKSRPWINAEGASTSEIVKQVNQCPSGALTTFLNEDNQKEEGASPSIEVDIMPNGPLIIKGTVDIRLIEGDLINRKGNTALCRCGASSNKPFCDGSHRKVDFKD